MPSFLFVVLGNYPRTLLSGFPDHIRYKTKNFPDVGV